MSGLTPSQWSRLGRSLIDRAAETRDIGCRSPRVRDLYLSRTKIGDAGLAHLAQTQHSCHRGQSSEPEAVKMGHRGGMRLPVSPLGISLSELAVRNRPRFEGVTRSGPLDSASFSSPFA